VLISAHWFWPPLGSTFGREGGIFEKREFRFFGVLFNFKNVSLNLF
jgi:hypothetical protein